jgi:hypothetical protein
MAKDKICEVCETRPATVRIVAGDVFGTVLDSVYVCKAPECIDVSGERLRVGDVVTPFAETDRT